MKRILLRSLVAATLVTAAFFVYAWLHHSSAGAVWPSSELSVIELPHRLRTGAEHDSALARNGGNPYVLAIDPAGDGELLYYGASHETDPRHPQVADITSRWEAFRPTIALYEGRSRGYFYGSLIEAIGGLPEPALVHKLARRDDVPLVSLEPAYADEVAGLLDEFTAEQVALYFFLRVYTSEAGGSANEDLALDLLAKRTDVDGLRGTFPTLADVDRAWTRDFPADGDWRTLQGEPGYLADVAIASRRVRGEHMARLLSHLVRRGERVFAVVGSGNVIRQEWNLRALLGVGPAWDQPDPGS